MDCKIIVVFSVFSLVQSPRREFLSSPNIFRYHAFANNLVLNCEFGFPRIHIDQ